MDSEVDVNMFARLFKNAVTQSDIMILDSPKTKDQKSDYKDIDRFVIRKSISREGELQIPELNRRNTAFTFNKSKSITTANAMVQTELSEEEQSGSE